MRTALTLLLLVPLFAAAQEDSLRAQIRSDLEGDPNTAQLSEAEREALVEALAEEAESSGEAEVYMDAQSAPTFTYDAPPPTQSPLIAILTAPGFIAVLALFAGILLVAFVMLRHRGKKTTDLQNAGE